MNGMDSQKRDAIARKAWCQAIVKLPSAYATSRDIAKLLNVCKTKSIQILKAAGGVKIAGVWRGQGRPDPVPASEEGNDAL